MRWTGSDVEVSASGSAIGTSLSLALGALATETSGSILLPAEKSNIVGIKPTMGLVSRSMVIPISLRQDTLGTHARTVKDAAYLLSAIAGMDRNDNWTSVQPFVQPPDYAKACSRKAFRGAKIGVPRNGIDVLLTAPMMPVMQAFERALELMNGAGAEIFDHVNFASFDLATLRHNGQIVLDTDLPSGLQKYFRSLATNPNGIHTLRDLARYTENNPKEGWPDRDVGSLGHVECRRKLTLIFRLTFGNAY